MVPFRKVTDNDANKIQANVKEFADSVVSLPILSGNLLEDIDLSSTQTLVPHKLDRAIRGYMIVAKNANINVWRSATTLPKQFLPLTASGNVTVSLWVF